MDPDHADGLRALPDDAPVTVRRLTVTDDPARLRALRLEMLADTPIAYLERHDEVIGFPADYWVNRLRRYTVDPSRCTFVAERAGRWVAQAGGVVDPTKTAHLVSVYITPALRGSGLLERLAEEVYRWARDRGSTEIRLEVARENARAVAAYVRLGYRPTGRTQPHPLFPKHSLEIEMARPLYDGDQAQSGPNLR